jgi:hypothetical protein
MNCDTCSSESVCTQCSALYVLDPVLTYKCTCDKYLTTAGVCMDCAVGTYFDGTSECLNCAANCTECAETTGLCTTCTSPFVDDGAGACVCPSNHFENSNTCTAYTSCSTGYYNDGANNCLECGLNCYACTDITGVCTSCNSGSVDSSDNTKCSCNYPIGPSGAPTRCRDSVYDSTRVVPVYSVYTSEMNWATEWALVNSIKDQGLCNAGYAFATAALYESAFAIIDGEVRKFSEQQLISCDTSNYGCSMGDPYFSV